MTIVNNVWNLPNFQSMIDDGYITVKPHPIHSLHICNYTAKAQYENAWNQATLMCRGLIVDRDGNVVARPFEKFFNLEQVEELPDELFTVHEKLDGSLGILYWLNNVPHIATRGSFNSEQALWATQWIQSQDTSNLRLDCTYLFEIIYPRNRIVVDYGDRSELVMLAIIHTGTGKEYPLSNYQGKIATAKKIQGIRTLDDLLGIQQENAEGFVIRFDGGTRVKVKFSEYVRLHRIITGVNESRILDMLADSEDIASLLESVPDEFYKWVTEVSTRYMNQYRSLEAEALAILGQTKASSRKEYAECFAGSNLAAILFAMLDGKQYDKMIWKLIKQAN